jgi:hypothetical protein
VTTYLLSAPPVCLMCCLSFVYDGIAIHACIGVYRRGGQYTRVLGRLAGEGNSRVFWNLPPRGRAIHACIGVSRRGGKKYTHVLESPAAGERNTRVYWGLPPRGAIHACIGVYRRGGQFTHVLESLEGEGKSRMFWRLPKGKAIHACFKISYCNLLSTYCFSVQKNC